MDHELVLSDQASFPPIVTSSLDKNQRFDMRRVLASENGSFGQEQIGVMMKNFDSFQFPATTRRYADFYLIFCTRTCDIIIYTELCYIPRFCLLFGLKLIQV